MKKGFPRAMESLIAEFCKMPGIGPRSAERLTFHILQSSSGDVDSLLRFIRKVKDNIRFCERCNNLSEIELCDICSDASRDISIICVVQSPNGIISMEKSGSYRGVYHVLLGELSPIDGVEPEDLKIKELVERVSAENINEIILATDFTTEGETTALYLRKVLNPLNVKVTRLSRGVPVGANIEYADAATLQIAFEGRVVI